MVFRDVREVDGKPVRDQEDRIVRLLTQPFDNAVRRAREIHRDGLRFNVDNGRMMDPLTAIGYLRWSIRAAFDSPWGAWRPTSDPTCGRLTCCP